MRFNPWATAPIAPEEPIGTDIAIREITERVATIAQRDLNVLMREASTAVEDQLRLEDAGWRQIGSPTGDIIRDAQRIINLQQSRLYHLKDPLAHQAVRLWTDYTFGPGMTWSAEDEGTKKVMESFWNNPANRNILSARGQRMSNDKLMVDGEVFFALFLSPSGAIIRRIDPLEITEIISDPEDVETVMYYRRLWAPRNGMPMKATYRSANNLKDQEVQSWLTGGTVKSTEEAIVFHLTYNTITQRGNPLLLPALDWLKQYRRFLASRVAVMLAIAKFAWKAKVAGGQAAVDATRATLHDEAPNAGSTIVENMGVDTTPIKSDTGAKGASADARMIRLQFIAASGFPEQYYGDIATGNLATAKTVELPVMKMIQSLQRVWSDFHQEIDEVVLAFAKIDPKKWYVDRDFPPVATDDIGVAAKAITDIITAFPEFKRSPDVQQQALMVIGINNTGEVLDALKELPDEPVETVPEQESSTDVQLVRVLKDLKVAVKESGENGHHGD